MPQSLPKVAAPPPAPPPAPLLPDTLGSQSNQATAAAKAAGAFGFDGTILTGPSGTAAPKTAAKTLFGQ